MSELHVVDTLTIMAVTIGYDHILSCPRLVLHDNGGYASHYLRRTPESGWEADVRYDVNGNMTKMEGKLVGVDPVDLAKVLSETWEVQNG